MKKEKWLPVSVEGYSDRYKISNYGNVINSKTNKPIAICDNGKGYKFVHFFIGKKCKYFTVHRLVALAFIPNPENKPDINHKNHVKADNTVWNLEWCTAKENTQYSFKYGKMNSHTDAKIAHINRLGKLKKGKTLAEFRIALKEAKAILNNINNQ